MWMRSFFLYSFPIYLYIDIVWLTLAIKPTLNNKRIIILMHYEGILIYPGCPRCAGAERALVLGVRQTSQGRVQEAGVEPEEQGHEVGV